MGKTAVILALGFSAILGKMLIGINEREVDLTQEVSQHYEAIISRNIANSAANMAVSQLFRDFEWRAGLDSTLFHGGEFKVKVRTASYDSGLTLKKVNIIATSKYMGRKDSIVVEVAQPPFSYFASFNAQWPTNLYYGTGDTLWGPIHTNQKFGFAGYPVFFGKVTSVDPGYNTWGPTEPVFLGGSEFGVDPITLPTSVPMLEDSANAGGDIYATEVWLRFNATGTYDFGPDNTFSGGTKNLADYNGIIMSADLVNIHVQGIVSGQVTVYSGRNIYIEDNIVYNYDPRVYPNSTDILGLVAKENVMVTDSQPNKTDVEIHAAIMALDDYFGVENYNSGGPRGTLTLLGSISQVVAYPYATATMEGTELVITNGYSEKSIYDDRFLEMAPPVFPVTPRVVVFSWQESAGIDDFNDKDTVCHNGNNMELAPNAVSAHLGHGDTPGACPANVIPVN